MSELAEKIKACNICEARFKATHSAHAPRPVVWFRSSARIVIAGQAPGMKVYQSGRPFTDPSGDRLRDWMGVTRAEFYDLTRISIVPAAFCFPGYDAKGSDLPPPKICAETWGEKVQAVLPKTRLTLLVGGYAHRLHLGEKRPVSETVHNWRAYGPNRFVLPHPSWRNTGWIKKHPWFEAELLPELRREVREALI
ncbi:MAG: uracil-DNA glycosylase family protein [Halocynthiibacter sp.]